MVGDEKTNSPPPAMRGGASKVRLIPLPFFTVKPSNRSALVKPEPKVTPPKQEAPKGSDLVRELLRSSLDGVGGEAIVPDHEEQGSSFLSDGIAQNHGTGRKRRLTLSRIQHLWPHQRRQTRRSPKDLGLHLLPFGSKAFQALDLLLPFRLGLICPKALDLRRHVVIFRRDTACSASQLDGDLPSQGLIVRRGEVSNAFSAVPLDDRQRVAYSPLLHEDLG